MTRTLLRRLSVVGLLLVVAACGRDPESAQPPGRLASFPQWCFSSGVAPFEVEEWRLEEGTRSIFLTIYDDASAILSMPGPAESVPHWGELHYPEKQGWGSLARVGDRIFLVFCYGDLEVAEIARGPRDRLALWFHHDIDLDAEIVPQLDRLPRGRPSRAVELVLVPLAELPDASALP